MAYYRKRIGQSFSWYNLEKQLSNAKRSCDGIDFGFVMFLPVPVGAMPTTFRAAEISARAFDSKEFNSAGQSLNCMGVGFTVILLDEKPEFFLELLWLRLDIRSSVPRTICKLISAIDVVASSL